MIKYIKTICLGALALGLASCDDFLDRQPEAVQIPENFFNNSSNLSAFTQDFYTWFRTHSNNQYGIGTFADDDGTDNQARSDAYDRWAPGFKRVGGGTDNWYFGHIRNTNYFFHYAQPELDNNSITGSETEIRQAFGEAYFFRAYAYWEQYQNVGDFPILEGLLPNDENLLLEQSVRQPRNKVARYILDNLAKAAELLPETSSKGKNGLNKDCANLLRSRVALFEGTWLKYHKGTALVPGGKGWPGDAALLDGFDIDSEINYFLTEAMTSAKAVGEKYVNNLVENTDAPESVTYPIAGHNPYYTMFSDDNLDGYSEVLLYKRYSLALNQSTQMQEGYLYGGISNGWTHGMVQSFLMMNGLPVYAAGSGFDPEWENQGVKATLQGRDSRIRIFTMYDLEPASYSTTGEPYIYSLGVKIGRDNQSPTTGFIIKKGNSMDQRQNVSNLSSTTGSIIYRASEALLNYIEACVEKNGSVDNTADSYWRAIRRRAKVDEDYNKTIAATDMAQEARYDFGAYSHNKLVEPLLYNVRRERRAELMAESHRYNDLRRWRALDQLESTPYQIEGCKFWNTVYTDPNSDLSPKRDGQYFEPTVSVEDGGGMMSPRSVSDYIRPYQKGNIQGQNIYWNGYRYCEAHYLEPLGQQVFEHASPDGSIGSSVVYQNPGWPKIANEPAIGY